MEFPTLPRCVIRTSGHVWKARVDPRNYLFFSITFNGQFVRSGNHQFAEINYFLPGNYIYFDPQLLILKFYRTTIFFPGPEITNLIPEDFNFNVRNNLFWKYFSFLVPKLLIFHHPKSFILLIAFPILQIVRSGLNFRPDLTNF